MSKQLTICGERGWQPPKNPPRFNCYFYSSRADQRISKDEGGGLLLQFEIWSKIATIRLDFWIRNNVVYIFRCVQNI